MKIGCLFTAYNMEEYIHQSLAPWISAKDSKLLGHEFLISAVSVPFKEYEGVKVVDDDTIPILEAYKRFDHIRYLVTEPKFVDEATARNLALKPLLEAGCEIIVLVDADEIFTVENIENILSYVELEKFISWFKFSYKNYVFDDHHFLKDPFTPPRLFRVNTNGFKLTELHWDNDVVYKSEINIKEYQKSLPSKTIPAKIAWITHKSWLSNSKSKDKVKYQEDHFKNGAGCSFAWDEKSNSLIWNKDFFAKTGQSIPEVIEEN